MEEVREAIQKLQLKFRELVATDDAMKDVINCHNKKDKENPHGNEISLVKKGLSKLQTRIDSVENNLVEGFKSTTEKQKEVLQELLEDNDRKIREEN